MHKYSKNPWGQIPLLKFLSIYSREVFHKKSWVVVIFHFEEQSLVSSHPFCIRDREMRFSPLFCKLNVVINRSKFQQNRPTQSRDIAWNMRSKIKFNPNSFYSCLFYHAREWENPLADNRSSLVPHLPSLAAHCHPKWSIICPKWPLWAPKRPPWAPHWPPKWSPWAHKKQSWASK